MKRLYTWCHHVAGLPGKFIQLENTNYQVLCYTINERGYSDHLQVELNLEIFARQYNQMTEVVTLNKSIYQVGFSIGGQSQHLMPVNSVGMISPKVFLNTGTDYIFPQSCIKRKK